MAEQIQTARLESVGGDAAACLAAGRELGSSSVRLEQTKDGLPVFIIKDGYKVEQHPELLPRPSRPTGLLVVHNTESFCRHFAKYKDGDSIILVDADPEGKCGANYIGILNYHATDKAAHGDFRVQYTAELSVEWQRWMSKNGKMMAHVEFLEHLEDVKDLIKEPDGAGLLDLISALEGKVNARFENALNLHNGRMRLGYAEDVELKAGDPVGATRSTMEVPTVIVAGIAPFEFGAPYRMENKLRYRIQNRQLCFAYEAQETHLIIQNAVKDQVADIAAKTETTPLYGVPPVK